MQYRLLILDAGMMMIITLNVISLLVKSWFERDVRDEERVPSQDRFGVFLSLREHRETSELDDGISHAAS